MQLRPLIYPFPVALAYPLVVHERTVRWRLVVLRAVPDLKRTVSEALAPNIYNVSAMVAVPGMLHRASVKNRFSAVYVSLLPLTFAECRMRF